MVSQLAFLNGLALADNLPTESGLLIFKLIEGTLAHADVRVEVLMDDYVFPSYSSAKVKSRHSVFGESGYSL